MREPERSPLRVLERSRGARSCEPRACTTIVPRPGNPTMQTHVRTVAIRGSAAAAERSSGVQVADRLGFRFVDRDMLRVAADNLAIMARPPRLNRPARRGGRGSARRSRWVDRTRAAGHRQVESVYEGDLFEIEQRLLCEIVDDEPAVIVGRGAARIERTAPGC